jgi:aubergine-like protein
MFCCLAVPSQVITARCMTNKNAQSIALKVAVQINCKLGGAPWTVDVPLKGSMIVGFDIAADTLNKSQSFGALVATLDNNLSKYFAKVSAHRTTEELSNELSNDLLMALYKYKQHNGALPARIIVYRDGVGDGQIQYVHQQEVDLIKVWL